jgi:DNA-binding response OmpR family regulator
MMRERACETVMLVNDDRSFVDVTGDALRMEGLAVLLVPGVQQAIAAVLAGFRPDAVLLDLSPRTDMGKFRDALSAIPGLDHVPVLRVERDSREIVAIPSGGDAQPVATPTDARELALTLDALCRAHGSSARRARDERMDDTSTPTGHA